MTITEQGSKLIAVCNAPGGCSEHFTVEERVSTDEFVKQLLRAGWLRASIIGRGEIVDFCKRHRPWGVP